MVSRARTGVLVIVMIEITLKEGVIIHVDFVIDYTQQCKIGL